MSSQIKKDELREDKGGKILISKESFRNMITHVLRFGNEELDNSEEVMGICIGKIAENGKDLILNNAIPVTHGDKASLGFSKETLALFEKIKEKFNEKDPDLLICGWYQSRPGWGLDFTKISISNHHYFQKEQNPNGFCIVFDHTLMGKDGKLGFEIFRLNNYEDLRSMEFHFVDYELEIPKTLEYFKWAQKFVEDFQKINPVLIKEIDEFAEQTPSDLQEIPIPEKLEKKELEQGDFLSINPIISGFQNGGSKLMESFTEAFKQQLGEWTQDINIGSLEGTEFILKSLNQMKDKVSFGMSKLQNWFDVNLNEILANFKNSVTNYIDNRLEAQYVILDHITKSKDENNKKIIQLLENNYISSIKNIELKSKDLLEKINNNFETNSKIEELLSKNSLKISEIEAQSKNLANGIKQLIPTTLAPFEQDLMNDIENLSKIISNFEDSYSNMNNKFQELKKNLENLKEQ